MATATIQMVSQDSTIGSTTTVSDTQSMPITGWQDILEIVAEAGLEPVGQTFQNGMNFAAAFQPAGFGPQNS